ncbi:substrate-binding domain-containing protein [Geodermatophilus sp. SYSU D00691]
MPVTTAREGRATLATVAAAAGVSVATVSKVLNGRSDVAPATRGLVQNLLVEYDYVGRAADSVRRAVPTVRPTVELVYAGDGLNAYSTEVLQGVLGAAGAMGVAVVVSIRTPGQRRSESGRPAAWAGELAAAGRRAVIAVVDELTTADLTALSRARLPLVVIDPVNLPHADVPSVGSTNFTGGLSATQHLLDLGHRRIAYVGGPVTSACNQARLHGYRAAMDAAGAPVPPEYVRFGDFRHADGLAQGGALLDLPEPPTAVFAGADETAVGVLEAARARGLRIPEDLSVVGFDDTEVARLSSPALTTVRQPLQEMGTVALRTALQLADGQPIASHHVELATELVVRQSAAPAPA